MKKITYNGKEIKLGEKVEVMVAPHNLAKLAKEGYIEVTIVPTIVDLLNYESYISDLALRMNISKATIKALFNKLMAVGEYSVIFNMLLREIALALDEQYPDHIKESDTVYTFSVEKGRIVELPASSVRSWNNFAAFRNIEDARTACKKLSPFIRAMYERK